MDVDSNEVLTSKHFDAIGGVVSGFHLQFILHGRNERTAVWRLHLHVDSAGDPELGRRDRWTGLQELTLPAARPLRILRSSLTGKQVLHGKMVIPAPPLPFNRTRLLLGGIEGRRGFDELKTVISPGMLLIFGDEREGNRASIELPIAHIYQIFVANSHD